MRASRRRDGGTTTTVDPCSLCAALRLGSPDGSRLSHGFARRAAPKTAPPGDFAMTESQNQCLDTFPEWLRTLASDAADASRLLSSSVASESARRCIAGGLNYLFKSLDLIPDGIEDLGFLDDAFVLRTAAAQALQEAPDA